MFAPPNAWVSAPPGVTSTSAGFVAQSVLWLTTKMSQVSPTIAGKRVGSIATLTGALTLNARTYSKNGYAPSEFPASSVFVIAADAGSVNRKQRATSLDARVGRWAFMGAPPAPWDSVRAARRPPEAARPPRVLFPAAKTRRPASRRRRAAARRDPSRPPAGARRYGLRPRKARGRRLS